MANEPQRSRVAPMLYHCRQVEQRISLDDLATCLIKSGFPSYDYSHQRPGSDADRQWLVTSLRDLERATLHQLSPFHSDPRQFIDAVAVCLPRARKAADRLTFAFANDELQRYGLPPFF